MRTHEKLARQIAMTRRAIQKRLRKMVSPTPTAFGQVSFASAANAGDHIERAQQEFLRWQAMRAYAVSASQARALDRAWENVQQGRYGVCQMCGEEIPLRRLKAVPVATFCVSCQEARELAQAAQKKRKR